MMNITDINGKVIEISDLDLAIIQADDFRHYSTTQPEQLAFVLRQQAYWQDIYQKLLSLKSDVEMTD
jgi:hypothetical protein